MLPIRAVKLIGMKNAFTIYPADYKMRIVYG